MLPVVIYFKFDRIGNFGACRCYADMAHGCGG